VSLLLNTTEFQASELRVRVSQNVQIYSWLCQRANENPKKKVNESVKRSNSFFLLSTPFSIHSHRVSLFIRKVLLLVFKPAARLKISPAFVM
jgi:hypothetical protein